MRLETATRLASAFCLALGTACIIWSLSSCATTSTPHVDLSSWAGDSTEGGVIRRAQENKKISCSDPSFNAYSCMTYKDLQKLFNAIEEECGQPLSTLP